MRSVVKTTIEKVKDLMSILKRLTSFLRVFLKLTPRKRLEIVRAEESTLERLNEHELDEVGRLLCHASSKQMREEYPIIGDLNLPRDEAQALFEESTFGIPGDPSKPPSYSQLEPDDDAQ